MLRMDLGGGAVAFEIEGEADRVGSLDPRELAERQWPKEVVENYVRYRRDHADVPAPAPAVLTENASTSDQGNTD